MNASYILFVKRRGKCRSSHGGFESLNHHPLTEALEVKDGMSVVTTDLENREQLWSNFDLNPLQSISI